jgi:hypothetical protein
MEDMEGVQDEESFEAELVVASMVSVDPAEDSDAHREELESVTFLQEQLRSEGVDVDLLAKPGAEVWTGTIPNLGALYQLARLARYLELGRPIDAVLADSPAFPDDIDPVVADVWDELADTRFPQLVNLRGINTYYLPVDFDGPIVMVYEDADGEEDEATFGSAVRLLAELDVLEPLLREAGVAADGDAGEVFATLREAARQSVANDLPVIVW